jgi:hypothetical protein
MSSTDLVLKTFLASLLTSGISQITGFMVLSITKNPIYSILWIQIFGNFIAYFGQSYAFGFSEIINGMVIRWCIVVAYSLIINIKVFNYLDNLKMVKKLRQYFKGVYLDLYNFLILTISIIVVFLVWNFPMRKYYVFIDRESHQNDVFDLLLIIILANIFVVDKYIMKN